MASIDIQNFEKRIARVNKRHRKLARGYVTSVNHDGLVIARPRRGGIRFPWAGVMLTFVALFAFKGFLHVQLGSTTYDERVVMLQDGNAIEKLGAVAMTADPVTLWVASQISLIIR